MLKRFIDFLRSVFIIGIVEKEFGELKEREEKEKEKEYEI